VKSYYKMMKAMELCIANAIMVSDDEKSDKYRAAIDKLLALAKTRDAAPPGIPWVKLSKREPEDEGEYLVIMEDCGSFLFGIDQFSMKEIFGEPSFSFSPITHWAEINPPEE